MDDETQTTGTAAPADDATTASDQDSKADVQTNTDAPEAAQDTKEPEVKATETAEEKLYAGKYKTVDELEKAYTNANSEASKMSQEKADLTRILNEAFTTPDTSVAETASDDYEETSPQVNPEIEQLKRDNAVVKFIMGHQDADGSAMQDILSKDPMIKQIQGHDAKLEYAYLVSQNMSRNKAVEEAKKTGAQDNQAKTAEKQAAQVEEARKAEPVGEDSLLEKATGNYSPEERAAARKALIKKHLIKI